MARAAPLLDEIGNELDTWPGVEVEEESTGTAVVRYEGRELGRLHRDRGVVELRFDLDVRDELVEHGDAEPADPAPDSGVVRHDVEGPSDVTAALDLFDRRYRELRGEEYPSA